MKKVVLVFAIVVIAKLSASAQSAVAIFKPLYGGDEHYCIVSAASSEYEAKQKALDCLASTVNEKVGSGANGRQFIYMSTSQKGYFAVGRGRDQYGKYWHYEAVLGYDDADEARKALLSNLSGRGLYDTEVVEEGHDPAE